VRQIWHIRDLQSICHRAIKLNNRQILIVVTSIAAKASREDWAKGRPMFTSFSPRLSSASMATVASSAAWSDRTNA